MEAGRTRMTVSRPEFRQWEGRCSLLGFVPDVRATHPADDPIRHHGGAIAGDGFDTHAGRFPAGTRRADDSRRCKSFGWSVGGLPDGCLGCVRGGMRKGLLKVAVIALGCRDGAVSELALDVDQRLAGQQP